jgi:hypothetical protein
MKRNIINEVKALSASVEQAAQKVDEVNQKAELESASGQGHPVDEQASRSANWSNAWLNSWTRT